MFIFNTTTLTCQISCNPLRVTNSTGYHISDTECECLPKNYWIPSSQSCIADCTKYTNMIYSNYYKTCVPDCNNIPGATGPVFFETGAWYECPCGTGTYWNNITITCGCPSGSTLVGSDCVCDQVGSLATGQTNSVYDPST